MINKQLINLSSPATSGGGSGNQEEGLILHLDANDVDSYDGDGTEWVDITNHEYTPTTNVSEHFNTVTYTGTGTTNPITVGFQPDLIWIKNRDQTDSYAIVDSVRGITSPAPYLASNETNAEATSTNMPTSVQSDGFTITGSGGRTNTSGEDYVAWCFKAGGAPSGSDKVSIDGTSYATISTAELTDGTIPIDKLSVNTNLGFSIVSYNGNQVSNATVAHGLGVKPELIIVKNLQSAVSWGVWTTGISDSEVLRLDQIAAKTTPATAYFEPQNNTSNFFSLGTNDETNHNDDYIAYCFASKRGVSKVGSYVGISGSQKIYTGFEPSFILIKKTNTSTNGDWAVFDNARVNGTVKGQLYPSVNYAEENRDGLISFNRDGFTLENNTVGQVHTSGHRYIYYAIAKNTNETSLIPDTDLELHLDAASFPEKGESGYSNTPSTWTDSSGNSNNGTITGATFDSELGNYLDLDGSSDKITFGSSAITAFNSNNRTVEFWFKSDDLSATKVIFIADGSGYSYGRTTIITTSSGNIQVMIGNNGSYPNVSISANTWYHFAVSKSGTSYEAFLDGESIGTAIANTWNDTVASQLKISGNLSSTYPFDGQVGQLRLYSSALTQDQIRQNYNFTKPNYPNGFDGDISGATWNSAGYFQFDGSNDEIELTSSHPYSSNAVQTNSVKSITGWVKLDSGTRAMLYSISSTANSNYYFTCQVRNDSNGVFMQCRDGGTTNSFIDKATNSAPDSNWHHYVFQIDGDERQIYIDGVKRTLTKDNRGTATDSSWISYPTYSSSAKHKIQKGREISAYYGTGKVSKVKHYTKPLTQAEITALYNEGE